MKKILLSSFLFLVSLISMNEVSALELVDGMYVNSLGVEMTEVQIENLRSLAFTERNIEQMTQEEFDYNCNLSGEVVSTDNTYYKTTYIPKSATTYSLNADDYFVLNEEISEEEYYNNSGVSIAATCGTGDSCWQTEYKKLETKITKISANSSKSGYEHGAYRLRSDLEWSISPKIRAYDVLATAHANNNLSKIAASQYAKQEWLIVEYDESDGGWNEVWGQAIYSHSHSYWTVNDADGYAVKMNLKNDEISTDGEHIDRVQYMSSYMYYDVTNASEDLKVSIINAYGSYQHATVDISLNEIGSLLLDISLPNIIKFALDNVSLKYDNMRGTHTQITNASWTY